MKRFINRTTELSFLERKYNAPGSQFVVIYGRRRVGKTELIKQFCSNKTALYLLADKRGTLLNLERFAEKAADHFGDMPPRAKDFYDLFNYITRHIDPKKSIVVIDEFSSLIERDETIPSIFQVIWDEYLKDNEIMLILCGSTISMMVEGVLSQKSPLYGRRTGQWELDPLKAPNIMEFHAGIDAEKAVELYSIFGGVPLYILEFDPKKDVFENIRDHILTRGEILYEEAEILLKEELKEYYLYIAIFEGIAKGKNRIVEISDYSKIPSKDMPKYMGTLMKLGLIGKEYPVTTIKKSKKTRYFIKDGFFRFYFRYVHPNKTEIESGNSDKVIQTIKNDFGSFVGTGFENIAGDMITQPKNLTKLPFIFNRIGRQWGKIRDAPKGRNTYEIDIVALNDDTKEILFIECKWKSLSHGQAETVLNDLVEKSHYVNWNNETRMEYFGIISKRIEKKDELKKRGFVVFDLDDF
ncbi:MAG: ATP-binding protein [Methanosarcinales archaeon]|nr:ATP-binding protein [Methanosarcinales archaeon]